MKYIKIFSSSITITPHEIELSDYSLIVYFNLLPMSFLNILYRFVKIRSLEIEKDDHFGRQELYMIKKC